MLYLNKKLDTSFSLQKRLASPAMFKAVFRVAKKIHSRSLALHVKQNNLAYPRLGIIVAKRNVRQAVARNLIKRMVRESFRLNQFKLHGFDIIVVIHHAFGLLSRQEMRKVIEEQWKKIVPER